MVNEKVWKSEFDSGKSWWGQYFIFFLERSRELDSKAKLKFLSNLCSNVSMNVRVASCRVVSRRSLAKRWQIWFMHERIKPCCCSSCKIYAFLILTNFPVKSWILKNIGLFELSKICLLLRFRPLAPQFLKSHSGYISNIYTRDNCTRRTSVMHQVYRMMIESEHFNADFSCKKIFCTLWDSNLQPSDSGRIALALPFLQGFTSERIILVPLCVASTLGDLKAVTKSSHKNLCAA